MLIGIIDEILSKVSLNFRQKIYMATFITAALTFKTFVIAGLSLMVEGKSLKTKRNLCYLFLIRKLPYAEIFRMIILTVVEIKNISFSSSYFPVIIDYTWINGRRILVAACPYRGRAVPFAFRITDFSLKGKKRKVELAFIKAIRAMVPEYVTVVIIGDREFAGKEFIRDISEIKGIEVVIRLKKNTNVRAGNDGKKICLREVKKSLYRCFYGETEGILYVEDKEDKVLVFGTIRGMGALKRFYKSRMGIEEMFRDLKSGLGLKKLQTEDRRRLKNLITVSFLAYLTVAVASNRLPREKNDYYSFFTATLYHLIIEPSVSAQIVNITSLKNNIL